jgi:ergothioneine biosynthesis protein EgtB
MTDAAGHLLSAVPELLTRFRDVREATLALASSLSADDCQLQSMPDASPTKWHLAHTSWFFETFLLNPHLPGYRNFDPAYAVLFNSYYVGVGDRHPRPQRGLISRPSVGDVYAYRAYVDAGIAALLTSTALPSAFALIELGIHHEQQHQELVLMDIQHAFSCNPNEPAYGEGFEPVPAAAKRRWLPCPGGLYMIGYEGDGFSFDNELSRHRVWLEPFDIADTLVTAGEYLTFIEDGGYRRPELWLSDGWAAVETFGWTSPLYWHDGPDGWTRFSLAGRRPIDPAEPVLHVSHYEADAFARWSGARLPTEGEWEVAITQLTLKQVDDVAWQWTGSAYLPHPGFTAAEGAVGEYNGKFMANQMVLKGGSFATPKGHSRPSYRNFFPPDARWLFSGIRLARNTR